MNWQKMIQEMLAAGLQQQQLAEQLQCGQSHISDLYNGKRGKRVSYDLGIRIVDLHRRVVGLEAAAS